jgi:Ca2+-dependent lipid-binding protein
MFNSVTDPYVKIWRIHSGRRMEKKKTTVREKTLNPIFEETLCFHVGLDQIRATSLLVTVMDFDRIGRNEPIGSVVLGSKSGPSEIKHWTEMFTKVRTPVTQWHVLKNCEP